MSDLPPILEAADALGKRIAEYPATKKLKGLLKDLDDNPDTQRLMNDLNRHQQTLAEKQAQGRPIEVEDKRKLEELQQAAAADPTFRDLQIAQMDYVDLMRQVDQRISPFGE
ncbi:MAG: YlbF family regulator [Planctomycetota bacterium]